MRTPIICRLIRPDSPRFPMRLGRVAEPTLLTALQAIPLLFRCFALHVRQSLWHMLSWMQGPLSRFLREVLFDPSPESLLQRLRLRVMEMRGDFVPGVSMAQRLESLTDLLALVLFDPAFDQLDQ